MKIELRYFASLREALGTGESVEVPDGITLGALRDWLCARGDARFDVLARPRPVRGAIGRTMRDETTPVPAGAEVAFFPPVTGG